jgi:hypothetical protein
MPKLQLVIHSADINSVNGHHTITASIEETDDDGHVIQGVAETFGIGFDELQQRFGGDIGKWRARVIIPALRDRHSTRKAINARLLAWQGTKIDIPAE